MSTPAMYERKLAEIKALEVRLADSERLREDERLTWDAQHKRQASVNAHLAALVTDAQEELRKCQQDAIQLQARLAAWETAAQQGHPSPCTLGPLCPYCEIQNLRAERDTLISVVAAARERTERAEARLAEAERLLALMIEDDGLGTRDIVRGFLGTADSASAAPTICEWTQQADEWGVWDAGCGLVWCFEEGGPTENGMKFCPGCGKPVAATPYVEPPVCVECGEELEDGICPDGCTALTVSARVEK